MNGIEVRNCSKTFGGKRVLRDVSFSVEQGEFCILLGPSGCGKSTLLRIIAGLEEPDAGEIFINGRNAGPLDPRDRDVAMVFQNYSLYPHMTVRENLAFPLKLRRMHKEEARGKILAAANLLGIGDLLDRKPSQLSGGQRQRVAIGRAIVRSPSLFLFDEPLSNLDARLRLSMRVELAGLHRTLGVTTLYVTHDQTEAMTLGQKLVLIEEGVVRQIGTPRDIYERPANLFAASFIGSPPINLREGTLRRGPVGAEFHSPPLAVNLPPGRFAGITDGTPVTAGIRPESVAVAPGSGCRIEHREDRGDDTILYLRAGPALITARAAANFPGAPGDPASLSVDPKAVHLFIGGSRVE